MKQTKKKTTIDMMKKKFIIRFKVRFKVKSMINQFYGYVFFSFVKVEYRLRVQIGFSVNQYAMTPAPIINS